MRFDLTDLRLFEAVAQAGSISGGAERMHMALASASARISGMEAVLGTALLVRARRGVAPTAAGRTLLHHARAILAQAEQMRGALRAFATGLKGEIRMLSNTAGLVELVPNALRSFLAANPGVDIDLEERTSLEIVESVAAGQAEFGVIAATADLASLELRPLGIDRLTAITAATSALALRQDISFAELLDEPFVGLTAGALHDHLARNAARLGRHIAYRVRLRNFDAVARLVEAGIGVGVLPLAAVARHGSPGLAALRLTDDWADRRLVVCARTFEALPVHARLFVDALVNAGSAAPALMRPGG
ncbi:LysR family transcriptional regulator [Labrys miyagiensis]|uniref:LysR family transcriptional regulator n=1 Tax=Labrys miyagiensis TaxID=346912 RepID=A0ABQ6CHL9_9HYPH|nr:LysR family transcriptional regulator [Labrys miyagiensis]GLS17772.1 LysR family transcriptional regulator [Labrys miyagiensis]